MGKLHRSARRSDAMTAIVSLIFTILGVYVLIAGALVALVYLIKRR